MARNSTSSKSIFSSNGLQIYDDAVELEQTLLLAHSAPKMWSAQFCHLTVIIADRGLPLPQHEKPLMTLKKKCL